MLWPGLPEIAILNVGIGSARVDVPPSSGFMSAPGVTRCCRPGIAAMRGRMFARASTGEIGADSVGNAGWLSVVEAGQRGFVDSPQRGCDKTPPLASTKPEIVVFFAPKAVFVTASATFDDAMVATINDWVLAERAISGAWPRGYHSGLSASALRPSSVGRGSSRARSSVWRGESLPVPGCVCAAGDGEACPLRRLTAPE